MDAIWLQSQPAGGLGFLVPFGAMLLIFYFLLIRPQTKKQREQEKLLAAIGKADRVVTTGGIHGLVVGAEKDVITLEVAVLKSDRVRIKLDRARIDRRVESADKSAKADEKGEA